VAKQKNYVNKINCSKIICTKSIRKHKLGPLTLLQVKSCFAGLIKDAKTTFGIDHHFDQIKTFEDFANRFQFDYEDLKPYVEKW
jgi:hypothetical protein